MTGSAILLEDLTGDGRADIVGAAPLYGPLNDGVEDDGRVYVKAGPLTGNVSLSTGSTATLTAPVSSYAMFGQTMASGDLNGEIGRAHV